MIFPKYINVFTLVTTILLLVVLFIYFIHGVTSTDKSDLALEVEQDSENTFSFDSDKTTVINPELAEGLANKPHPYEENESDKTKLSQDSFILPPADMLKIAAESLERRKRLISYQFVSNEQWNDEFHKDNYSEWGVKISENFRENILNNENWSNRSARFESAECKTRFCRLGFSFDETIPLEERNKLYPDMFLKSEPSLSYASFYEPESKMQYIYAERCLECD